MPFTESRSVLPVPASSQGAGSEVSIRDILARLRGMSGELSEFGYREEKQFLAIGGRLAEFHQRAKGVVRQSQEAIDCLMKDEAGGTLDGLRSLLDGLEAHIDRVIGEAQNNELFLSRLIQQVEQIERPLQVLAKVVKVLQALSFSTRVESTHGESGQILKVLADNLKDLAAKINDKTDQVRDRLESMAGLAVTARERMRRLQGDSLHRGRSILHQSRLLVDILGDRRRQSLADANMLGNHSRDVTDAIGEVVSSIQFHDITRQQVEHVRTNLEDLCAELTDQGDSDLTQLVILDICRVQSAQLRHTRGDLVSAVARIIKNLQEIGRSVGHIARQTRVVAGAAEGEKVTFFEEIEPVIDAVSSILAQSATDNQQARQAVTEVLVAMEELESLLDQIELIGTEMKLIAFNAGITAAHNMERGAGLGVIALSIQTLSGEVFSRTQEFSSGFRQMKELVGSLDATPEAETGLAGVGELGTQAASLIARLREMNRSLVQLLYAMDGEATALAQDIVMAGDTITIHADAGQVIDGLLGGLDQVIECCHFGISGIDPGERSRDGMLERFADRYTMQSEREVHRRVNRSEASPREVEEGKALRPRRSSQSHGLGENVELF